MFINIQFPFIDLRYFSDDGLGKLLAPDLPIIDYSKETRFIRNFGSVRSRDRSGIGYDETAFVDAKRAVRFPPKSIQAFNQNRKIVIEKILFRRLFFDGKASYRFEIGIFAYCTEADPDNKLNIEDIIKKILNIKVKIPKSKSTKKLGSALSSLVPLYLDSSTSKKTHLPSRHNLIGTKPMIYIEASYDGTTVPSRSKLVAEKKFGGFDLYYSDIRYKGLPYSLWMIQYDFEIGLISISPEKFYARNLRLALLRQHFERECLSQLLHCVIQRKIKPDDKFQDYINRCDFIKQITSRKSRRFRYNLYYRDLVREVFSYQDIIDPNQKQILIEAVSGIRRNIRHKIVRLLTIEFKGDLVMGNKYVNYGRDQIVVENGTLNLKNVTIADAEKIFNKLRKDAGKIENNEEIMQNIDSMQESVGEPSFADKIEKFVASTAKYTAMFAPVIPFLKKLIVK